MMTQIGSPIFGTKRLGPKANPVQLPAEASHHVVAQLPLVVQHHGITIDPNLGSAG